MALRNMALRNIVIIDEEKCNGCGECIVNCPEGALAIVDGKARVVKESYCDGLGVCIGKCPLGAISIERREAEAFDADAVAAHIASDARTRVSKPRVCPGSAAGELNVLPNVNAAAGGLSGKNPPASSRLRNWPVQLALVAADASFLNEADLLLVADCVPFAMADFHGQFLDGRPVAVACPKLDDAQAHIEKLASILVHSRPRSITIVHMEVPCCSGLCRIVKAAVDSSGRNIPTKDITVGINGAVLGQKRLAEITLAARTGN